MSEQQHRYVQSVGDRVRLARKQKNISQEKLAQRIDQSFATINAMENGRRLSSLNTLENIAGQLDVTLEWILTGAGQPEWVARDLNPEPTDSYTEGTPHLSVAAASKSRKRSTERVKRTPSSRRSSEPIVTRRQAS